MTLTVKLDPDLEQALAQRCAECGVPKSVVVKRALIEKYRDLPFDFADASVAVLAEQAEIGEVITLDRDFEIYRDSRGKRLKNLIPKKTSQAR